MRYTRRADHETLDSRGSEFSLPQPQDAITLGFLYEDVDTTTLLPALQRVFAQGAALSGNEDASATSSKYKVVRRRKQFHALSADLNQIFFEHPFQVRSRRATWRVLPSPPVAWVRVSKG